MRRGYFFSRSAFKLPSRSAEIMSATIFAIQYGELDSLFKKYREKKKKQSDLLHTQLEKEIAANVELRKHIALLESKLLCEKSNAAQMERLYRDAMSDADETMKRRDNQLREMASQLSDRLHMVEQRERECFECAAALELRVEQFWTSFNDFEMNKAEFEAGLAAYKRTMDAELRYGREAVHVAKDCLCDIKIKGQDFTGKEQEFEHELHPFQQRMRIEWEERSLRDSIARCEFEARCSIINAYFYEYNLQLKLLLSQSAQKESQLKTAADLLLLREVELSSRMRKVTDLYQDERSKAELQRKEFVLECRRVLCEVSDLLDSISGVETNTLRLKLEAKLQAMI
ncbi:hypothetical protein ABL78_4304 [Leptomonas seymouri]|uniref:Uncharacterized protein n=1 Tax=Leptomonas seymouri TaxID=5684 RepID=A0A0N0P5M0_LEPSE|nr:hypothetical protein ABL78_4304 [Leptomonas seymouri]|eukprot:KPI86626.1 hypothetical protein ABL78_4304 [Leptomonas seymouri]